MIYLKKKIEEESEYIIDFFSVLIPEKAIHLGRE